MNRRPMPRRGIFAISNTDRRNAAPVADVIEDTSAPIKTIPRATEAVIALIEPHLLPQPPSRYRRDELAALAQRNEAVGNAILALSDVLRQRGHRSPDATAAYSVLTIDHLVINPFTNAQASAFAKIPRSLQDDLTHDHLYRLTRAFDEREDTSHFPALAPIRRLDYMPDHDPITHEDSPYNTSDEHYEWRHDQIDWSTMEERHRLQEQHAANVVAIITLLSIAHQRQLSPRKFERSILPQPYPATTAYSRD